jgi:hypothetical protein
MPRAGSILVAALLTSCTEAPRPTASTFPPLPPHSTTATTTAPPEQPRNEVSIPAADARAVGEPGQLELDGVTYRFGAYWAGANGTNVVLTDDPIDCARDASTDWYAGPRPNTLYVDIGLASDGAGVNAFRGSAIAAPLQRQLRTKKRDEPAPTSFHPSLVRMSRDPVERIEIEILKTGTRGVVSLKRCEPQQPGEDTFPELSATVPSGPLSGTFGGRAYTFPHALAREAQGGFQIEVYAEPEHDCRGSFDAAKGPRLALATPGGTTYPSSRLIDAPQPDHLDTTSARIPELEKVDVRERYLGFVSMPQRSGKNIRLLVRYRSPPKAEVAVDVAGTIDAVVCD